MAKRDQIVLVLQGGGALGAYQAGVYEGIAETGLDPNWIAGVSIGAINAALIAGNPPERRVERLREFWDRVSSSMPLVAPAQLDPLRVTLNRLSAATAATFGVPGFYVPRQPPAFLAPDGTPEALSVYDTSPLRETLQELVDFDLLNRKGVRLSVGAVDLINRRLASSTNSKDYEFSRTTVRQLWQAGLDDVRRTVSHRAWLEARELVEGVRVFDLAG
jgi:NTE family protein